MQKRLLQPVAAKGSCDHATRKMGNALSLKFIQSENASKVVFIVRRRYAEHRVRHHAVFDKQPDAHAFGTQMVFEEGKLVRFSDIPIPVTRFQEDLLAQGHQRRDVGGRQESRDNLQTGAFLCRELGIVKGELVIQNRVFHFDKRQLIQAGGCASVPHHSSQFRG